jgi:hypothetical protein
MTDLKVDYAVLDTSESALARIAAEFESAPHHRDQLSDIWGSSEVADAMREFVDNWDRHRNGLLKSIKNVGSLCAATTAGFRECDRHLSDVLTDR